ncbi:MAG: aldo/keto reductase [Candidatus Sumerlaeota bacterium]
MQYREIGNSGIKASVVALGTWAIGGWAWGGTDKEDSIKAIHTALDNGVNLVDTAPMYGMGTSEEFVGEVIKDRRDDIVLATKCGLRWDTGKGEFFFKAEGKNIYRYLGPEGIKKEVEESLRRLKTDRIDLYQTHWQEETTPREDTMAALMDLRDEGKIRAVGVSNIKVSQLKEYLQVGPVASCQEKFSMLDRGIEEDLLPFCIENNIGILAYSPLALGLLSGKVTPDREFDEGDQRRNQSRFSQENRKRVLEMLDKFQPVCEEHSLTTAQVVIAWSVARKGITHVLVGARNEKQAAENAAAGAVKLSDSEIEMMDKAIGELKLEGE